MNNDYDPLEFQQPGLDVKSDPLSFKLSVINTDPTNLKESWILTDLHVLGMKVYL